jgi:hypothetical protein
MQAFFVSRNLQMAFMVPATNRLPTVLKIVRMASDETAELEVGEVDRLASSSRRGLLPFVRTNKQS